MMKFLAFFAVLTLAAGALPTTAASSCSAKSGASTAALVELYTSEGCDSCPPADRWLSGIKGDKAYAGRAVPLSMHVDYWDYIGWHDPYGQALFSARQREISGINHEPTIYTPQILVAGKDLHPGWFSTAAGFDEALAKVNHAPPRADLGLAIQSAGTNEIKVDASAKLKNPGEVRDSALYLALFENGLTSQVSAGENKGKVLKHDFVVRQWAGPFAFSTDGTLALARAFTIQTGWKKADLGFAAFVQNRGTGEVLQALQLTACN